MTAEMEKKYRKDTPVSASRRRYGAPATWRGPMIVFAAVLAFAAYPIFLVFVVDSADSVGTAIALLFLTISVCAAAILAWQLGIRTARRNSRRHLIATIATKPNAHLLQHGESGAFYANAAFYGRGPRRPHALELSRWREAHADSLPATA